MSPRRDRKSETTTREKWPQKPPSCLQVLISRFRRTGWWAHQGYQKPMKSTGATAKRLLKTPRKYRQSRKSVAPSRSCFSLLSSATTACGRSVGTMTRPAPSLHTGFRRRSPRRRGGRHDWHHRTPHVPQPSLPLEAAGAGIESTRGLLRQRLSYAILPQALHCLRAAYAAEARVATAVRAP